MNYRGIGHCRFWLEDYTFVPRLLANLSSILKIVYTYFPKNTQGGLIKLFETIKTTADVSNLPTSLQKAMDWGQIKYFLSL